MKRRVASKPRRKPCRTRREAHWSECIDDEIDLRKLLAGHGPGSAFRLLASGRPPVPNI